MKRLYKILRSVAVVILVIAFVLPAGVYVALSVPGVQHAICEGVERELSKLLTVDVEIDHVSITPFNRLTLHRVRVADANGDTAMTVRRIGGGVELWELLSRRRLVMSYAEVIGMDAKIYRDSAGGPLNIQPIIDALSPKDKSKPPTRFDFRVNTVVIRTSSVRYDVLSAPEDTARLDVNHIYVSDVKADVQLPRMANDDYTVELRRLAMREKSGLVLERLSGKFHVWNEGATAEGVEVRMPSTRIALGDISTVFGSLKGLKDTWRELPVELRIEEGSYVNPSDFKALAPVLGGLDVKMDVWAHVMGNPESVAVQGVSVASEGLLSLKAEGTVDGMCTGDISADFPMIELNANGAGVAEVLRGMVPLHENAVRVLGNVGELTLTGDFSGDANAGRVQADVDGTGLGLGLTCDYRRRGAKLPVALKGVLALRDFNGAELLDGTSVNLKELTKVTAEADFDIVMNGKKPSGEVDMLVSTLVYKNHEYTGITSSVSVDGTHYSGSLNVDNPGVMLDVTANADVTAGYKRLDFDVSARDVNPALLNMPGAREGYLLSMFGRGELEGRDADSVVGRIDVNDVTYVDASGRGLRIDNVTVESECADSVNRVTLRSDVADGSVTGRYRLTKIPAIAKTIVANVMPKLTGVRAEGTEYKPLTADVADELTFDLTIKDSRPIEELVKLPVKVIYPVNMDGYVNARNQAMGLKIDAPYLQQGNKLIENTALHVNVVQDADVDSVSHADVYFTTMMPTKKGVLTLSTTAAALDDRVDAKLSWKVNRERNFSGDVNVSASFDRDEDNALMTVLDINPSKLVFNDTVWTVDPARITIRGKEAEVRDFRMGRSGQFLTIGGRASAYAGDSIMVELQDVNLDYVFETLDISNAMFGGNATGKIYATELFSKTPRAYTPGLNVARMSYNHSLMGDARIISEWVPETKAITINAEIVQPNGRRSYVSGDIKPMADSLDLHFDADKLEIGFLQPFMSAFATEVSGYASGKARLWGSFKLIDMVGDVYGEDVRLKLGFTNTAYTTTDSVRFTPGRIDLRDLTLYDAYGNTAKLNGWLTHECFKKPRFNFTITDARRMLVYDVKENNDTRWYGRIFGNGGASVTGEPGVVEIGVNMSTAPNSMFTFVLSDELNAQEYNFITFRDRDQARKDSIAALSAPPAAVRELKERLNAGGGDGEPSVYKLNFAVDVTPQAQVNLIMDPVSGDRIRAYGHGNMRMVYNSADEDLRMNGTYTVERGNYNFTLQDIIIKDFTIKDGSSITFHGDPYAAELDIKATYAVNANLSDLDESFLADKDLNRTNVPVHALLMVTGDMRQPDINFDLEFPTLTQDTYRKVRSIVSTEEMMNRQIIYLLALNRFYTPDYMTATKGNELVSVASSTISSQLSSMLGQLSDNWNIAPNFRSDRGDFSDVEVDVALSSHLLNNRLLLNGNFGYRDKSLNNNSFIGDFDIEYLLNRSGSIRLKAYNRYNDQNFYVKSALTTQGVGVVFKRDFDDIFSFLRPWLRKRKKAQPAVEPVDSTATPDKAADGDGLLQFK